MVLVGQHVPAHALELLGHRNRVVVVEAVARMAEPVADHHRQAQLLGLVELLPQVRPHAPGAEGVGPGGGQHVLRPAAAGAHDEVRLAVAQELPLAVGGLDEFHRDGLPQGQRGQDERRDHRGN